MRNITLSIKGTWHRATENPTLSSFLYVLDLLWDLPLKTTLRWPSRHLGPRRRFVNLQGKHRQYCFLKTHTENTEKKCFYIIIFLTPMWNDLFKFENVSQISLWWSTIRRNINLTFLYYSSRNCQKSCQSTWLLYAAFLFLLYMFRSPSPRTQHSIQCSVLLL